MSVALDSVMESQAAQLNLLLYQIYRPYFNGKTRSPSSDWYWSPRESGVKEGICHSRADSRARARGNIFRRSLPPTLNRVGGPWVTRKL